MPSVAGNIVVTAGHSAQSSTRLQLLFPANVVTAELRGAGDPESLLPAERQIISHVGPVRAAQFAAGRACARYALSQIGVNSFPLIPGEHRAPIWPDEIVGSISHSGDYCGAAVAAVAQVKSLGLDIESISAAQANLWPRWCNQREVGRIDQLDARMRQTAAALIFAAKEAYYKAEHPLTGRALRFRELHVELAELPQFGQVRLGGGSFDDAVVRYYYDTHWMCVGVSLPAQ